MKWDQVGQVGHDISTALVLLFFFIFSENVNNPMFSTPSMKGVVPGTTVPNTPLVSIEVLQHTFVGAQWLSGRVLDSRPRDRGFEPHRRHCVVILEQETFILA